MAFTGGHDMTKRVNRRLAMSIIQGGHCERLGIEDPTAEAEIDGNATSRRRPRQAYSKGRQPWREGDKVPWGRTRETLTKKGKHYVIP